MVTVLLYVFLILNQNYQTLIHEDPLGSAPGRRPIFSEEFRRPWHWRVKEDSNRARGCMIKKTP